MLKLTFRDLNLSGADLSGAYLSGAYLRSADLRSADLRGAYLRGAYLSGAYLRGAYLSGADLSGAYLSGADLSGADLRSADLSGAGIGSHVLQTLAGRAHRSDGYEFLAFTTEAGPLLIRAGCRTFTPVEFEAHISAEYEGTPKAVETRRVLAFLKAQAESERWA